MIIHSLKAFSLAMYTSQDMFFFFKLIFKGYDLTGISVISSLEDLHKLLKPC